MSAERQLLELVADYINEMVAAMAEMRMPGEDPDFESVQRMAAKLDTLKNEFAALGIEVKWPF
jgi:hypothetical protein